jgi:hypothetical protein
MEKTLERKIEDSFNIIIFMLGIIAGEIFALVLK